MGADLYINKLSGNEAEGYFRDSYNVTNVFWKLGLSYWQIDKFVKERSQKRFSWSKMSVEHAQIILDAVKERKPQFDEFINNLDVNWLRENHAHVEDEGEDSVEGWKKYFINKYDELVKFLERAIELKSTMLWSV